MNYINYIIYDDTLILNFFLKFLYDFVNFNYNNFQYIKKKVQI